MTAPDSLSTPQYTAALALAFAHGHRWSTGCSMDPDGRPELEAVRVAQEALRAEARDTGHVSLTSIDACVNAAADAGYHTWPGIDRPALDVAGVHRHTTGTRRLTWEVTRNGSVWLSIWRPGGESSVIAADIPHGGTPLLRARPNIRVRPDALARHVSALAVALRALGVGEDVIRAIYRRVPDGVEWLAEADAREAARRACAENTAPHYRERGLSCEGRPWYVAGYHGTGGGGILEWCDSEADARNVLDAMRQDPRYALLSVGRRDEEVAS